MTKVSIIVPMYNCQNTVLRCVESLILQSENDIEILLVDDGSTDETVKICMEKANEDGRINVLSKENGGVSSARNLVLKMQQEIFCFFAIVMIRLKQIGVKNL